MENIRQKKDQKTIENMFDKIAPQYDLLNTLLSASQDKRWRKKMIQQMPSVSDGTLLDVATGTGDVLLEAFRSRNEYGHFIGVDISQNMLNLAQKKLSDVAQTKTLELKKMSAEKLAYPDRSMDCITISFGFRNVVDHRKALQEFHRVLKDGGTLLILEFFQPEKGFFSGLFRFYFRYILPAIGGLFSDKSAYTYLPKSVESFYSPSEIKKILKETSFTHKNTKTFLFGACQLVVSQKGVSL